MAVYVPNNLTGLASLQEDLDLIPLTKVFQQLRQESDVEVYLPKFRIESKLELVEPLKKVCPQLKLEMTFDVDGYFVL